MSKSKVIEPIPPKSDREELFDAILGPDEEMSEKVAEDIVETYGITGEQLVDKFKTRLRERIKEIRDEIGRIPTSLEATLRNVREYERERAPKAVGADEWVNEIFDVALLPNTHARPHYDFRNCGTGEVSEKDRKILNDLRIELEGAQE